MRKFLALVLLSVGCATARPAAPAHAPAPAASEPCVRAEPPKLPKMDLLARKEIQGPDQNGNVITGVVIVVEKESYDAFFQALTELRLWAVDAYQKCGK